MHKLSRRGSIKTEQVTSPLPAAEAKVCNPKVGELEDLLSSGDLAKDRSLLIRISVRANYLIDRLARSGSLNTSITELRHRLIRILAEVEPDDEDSSEEYVDRENTPKCKSASRVIEDIPDSEVGDRLVKENRIDMPKGREEILLVRDKPINLNSLNLKYNGSTCIRIFIERLEELRQAREIPEARMLTAFSDLLEGPPLSWFRCNKPTFNSYSELLSRLKEDFDTPDFDYQYKNEIRQRTQAKHETILNYISTMQGMFSRLSYPVSEEEQLEILMHNIRPEYMMALALQEVDSISKLKHLGKRLELAQSRANNFIEPKFNKTDNYYNPPSRSGKFPSKDYKIAAVNSSPRGEANITCWRCKTNEHVSNECRQAKSREILCYGCGQPGVTRPACPHCNSRVEIENVKEKIKLKCENATRYSTLNRSPNGLDKGKVLFPNKKPDNRPHLQVDIISVDSPKDEWYQYMLTSVKENPRKFPNFMEKDGSLFRYSKNKYNLTNECNWKLVVPEDNRLELLQKYHDDPTSAHLGVMKTHKRIALHYYWPRLYENVKDYVSKCEVCKTSKPVNTVRPGLMGNPKSYNLRKRQVELKIGQFVYKRTFYLSNKAKNFSSKLAPKFIKCVVTAKRSPLVYALSDLDGKCLGNYHIKDILKYDS